MGLTDESLGLTEESTNDTTFRRHRAGASAKEAVQRGCTVATSSVATSALDQKAQIFAAAKPTLHAALRSGRINRQQYMQIGASVVRKTLQRTAKGGSVDYGAASGGAKMECDRVVHLTTRYIELAQSVGACLPVQSASLVECSQACEQF